MNTDMILWILIFLLWLLQFCIVMIMLDTKKIQNKITFWVCISPIGYYVLAHMLGIYIWKSIKDDYNKLK